MRRASASRLGAAVLIVGLALVLPPVPASAASPHEKIAPPKDGSGAAVSDGWIVTLKRGRRTREGRTRAGPAAGGSVTHVYRHALQRICFKGSARRPPPCCTTRTSAPSYPTAGPRYRGHDPDRDFADPGDHTTQPSAFGAGFKGAGIRVAILDTGIDLTHPDLVANIDSASGATASQPGRRRTVTATGPTSPGSLPPPMNGLGVVGVAPKPALVPIKVLDDTGSGEWSNLICAIDYLTALLPTATRTTTFASRT